jgi:hypothetical protein
MKITQGSVTYTVPTTTTDSENNSHTSKTLDYYHCGPLPSKSNPQLSELVLLHGPKKIGKHQVYLINYVTSITTRMGEIYP